MQAGLATFFLQGLVPNECGAPCSKSIKYFKMATAAAAAKVASVVSDPCNPIDGSPPGFPVPGILQARTLEWVAISFSNA